MNTQRALLKEHKDTSNLPFIKKSLDSYINCVDTEITLRVLFEMKIKYQTGFECRLV